jgi:sialate O-acetylesterase
MNTFIRLLNCNKSDIKGKCERKNAFIGILIAFVAIIPGITISLANGNNGTSDFWNWLINSRSSTESHFITDKIQTRLVDLKGQWRFSLDDDMERARPDFDDSSWSSVKVPAYWEKEGYKNYNGYAWYRRHFSFGAENLSRPLYLLIGQIDDVDEVFVNGHRIGGSGHFPPNYSSAWNRKRIYRVPEEVVNEGSNVISVRVYDNEQGGGILGGKKIGLYTTDLPQPLIELGGEWKFKTGNDPSWMNETIDDAGFENIQVPFEWDAFGYKYYDGHAWYRKTFGKLTVSGNETLVLLLGQIDDTDEVFLNGERVGKTGELNYSDRNVNLSYYSMNREYEFSSSLLKETNTLAVHVHDSGGPGGIYSGPVGIMTKADYAARQKQIEESGKWHLDETMDWLLGRE